MDITEADRPSAHGKLLGSALALIEKLGRRDAPMVIPDCCLTCAFREGSLPNMSAGTGIIALNCAIHIDRDRFSCHHGMKDGEPTKICAGYAAAMFAPWSSVIVVLEALQKEIDKFSPGDDDGLRTAFDAWAVALDPKKRQDVYAMARMFAKSGPAADLGLDPAEADFITRRCERMMEAV